MKAGTLVVGRAKYTAVDHTVSDHYTYVCVGCTVEHHPNLLQCLPHDEWMHLLVEWPRRKPLVLAFTLVQVYISPFFYILYVSNAGLTMIVPCLLVPLSPCPPVSPLLFHNRTSPLILVKRCRSCVPCL